MAKLNDLFTVDYGNGFDLNKLIPEKKGIAVVTRTSKCNGISAYVARYKDVEPNAAGKITVALGGSVLSTHLQPEPFYTCQNVAVLTPKFEMSVQEKLFYCKCIRVNAYRYTACGREANSTLKMIELPDKDEIPQWVNETKIISLSDYSAACCKETIPRIDIHNWKSFCLENLFEKIEPCKCVNAGMLEAGNDIWYIGAKKKENGTMKKIRKNLSLITKGNCMVFIQNGQGSAGYANYVAEDFIGSKDLSVGYSMKLNKYNGMFLACIFSMEKYRYSFGRKWNGDRLKKSIIKLPVVKNDLGVAITDENGEFIPDWTFMENYIKSLPYSACI